MAGMIRLQPLKYLPRKHKTKLRCLPMSNVEIKIPSLDTTANLVCNLTSNEVTR